MSMHERLARNITEGYYERGIITSETEETAEFFRNPPQAIFVPDCYIPSNPEKARTFMEIRCSLAADVIHSHLSSYGGNQPVVMSFAGIHEDGESAGSEKVAGLLIDRGVSPEKIIALQTTITGSGDTMQLHAIHKTQYGKGPLIEEPIMIAVDDHYARRVRQSVINHQRAHRTFYGVRVYIIHPSHQVTAQLSPSGNISPEIRTKIERDIVLGKSGKLRHGWQEDLAWALSAIPVLRPLQQLAEEQSHHDMRHKEQSRYIAKRMKDAAQQWRWIRKKHRKLIKEENIKGFGAFSKKHPELLRYPDIPAHG